jgi:hypothetical protein
VLKVVEQVLRVLRHVANGADAARPGSLDQALLLVRSGATEFKRQGDAAAQMGPHRDYRTLNASTCSAGSCWIRVSREPMAK